MGTRSNPIQNFGGIGLSSRSSLALVAGSVNGSGTELPKSAVEQETPIRAKAAPISGYNDHFMVPAFKSLFVPRPVNSQES